MTPGQIAPNIFLWNGNPTGVSTSSFNPPKGALIIDPTAGDIYEKTSERGDNSGYNQVRNQLNSVRRVTTDFSETDGVLTVVPELVVPIAANQLLRLDYFLNLTDDSSSDFYKFDISIPSGASNAVFGSITETSDNTMTTALFRAFPTSAFSLGAKSYHVCSITVLVNNGATAGNVSLKFAALDAGDNLVHIVPGSCVAIF